MTLCGYLSVIHHLSYKQQQPKSKNTIPILLLLMLLRTRIMLIDCKLKWKVWISRKSMSVRRPIPLVESVLHKAQLIDSRFNTKTIYVYLYGNDSAEVNSFNTCAVRLNVPKVCENTIMEGELVLLNSNTFK